MRRPVRHRVGCCCTRLISVILSPAQRVRSAKGFCVKGLSLRMRLELAVHQNGSWQRRGVGLSLAAALLAAAQQPAQLEGKTAEQAFKNIQVLKGIPADQVIPTMRFMRDSLGGVACGFCHLQDRSADDKPQKQMARKMIAMEAGDQQRHIRRQRRGDLLHLPPRRGHACWLPRSFPIRRPLPPPLRLRMQQAARRTHRGPDPGQVH